MSIKVTFEFEDGMEAGALHLEHVPRVGDRVLWLTNVTDHDGNEYDVDREYPVAAVQWVLHADADKDDQHAAIATVHFGPPVGP